MSFSRSHRYPNKLLASLPAPDQQRLRSALMPVSCPVQHVLQKPGETLRTIYFPGDGACAVTQTMKSGRTVEVATVGNEGFIGMNALFGGDRWLAGALVKIPDSCAKAMRIQAFRRELNRRGTFARLINHYAQRFVISVMRTAACNALHSADERCARWLLTTRDHTGRNEFPLTQEFLAALLGVRRATATLSIGALRRARLIDYRHRHVIIRDRAGLESAACECYAVLKRQSIRLLL